MGYHIDYHVGKAHRQIKDPWKFLLIFCVVASLYLRLMKPELLGTFQDILISKEAKSSIEAVFLETTALLDNLHTFCNEMFLS